MYGVSLELVNPDPLSPRENTLLDWYTYGYDAGDNMSQRARYNAQSGTTDTWTYAYNNGNEQTSMTLNRGTPETRTYDDWGHL